MDGRRGSAGRLRRAVASSRRAVSAGAGVADQYVYSLTNFLPAVAVAREVSASTFGIWASVMLVYTLLLGAGRSAIGETLAIRARGEEDLRRVLEALRSLVARAMLAFGVPLVAAVVLSFSGRGGWGVWLWLCVMVLAAPFHLLQDAGRIVLLANRRVGRVLVSDAVWLGTAAAGFLPVGAVEPTTWVTLIWCLGGVVSCLLVLPPLWGRRVDLAAVWSRAHGVPSLLEYAMQPAVVQLSQLACGVIGAPLAVATLRGGATLFRPLQLALVAHRSLSLSTEVPRERSSLRWWTRSVGGASLTIGFGAVMYLMPSEIGAAVLGDTWSLVHAALVPLTLAQLVSLSTYAAVTQLKRQRRLRGLGSLRLGGAFAIPVCTVSGAALGGPLGAAWGLMLGQALGALWTVTRIRRVEVLDAV